MKTKLLLVDDHNIIKEGIRSLLSTEKDFEIVAEASNGKEAIEVLENQKIDIMILDINMPVMGGIECAGIVCDQFPEVKILALTMLNEEHHIRQMLKSGALGYILKNSGKDELLSALNALAEGNHYFSRDATEVVMRDMINGQNTEKKVMPENIHLTDREKDILKLISQEYTNQEIADKLFISVRTVDAHRRNLLQKIGARNTAGLAIYAVENNLHKEHQ